MIRFLMAAGLMLLPMRDAQAQEAMLSADAPLEITAEEALDWLADQRTLVARGGARAVQGGTTVTADTMTALYDEGTDGRSTIVSVTAEGSVRMVAEEGTVTGARAVYEPGKEVITVTGGPPVLITKTERIEAGRSLSYDMARGLVRADGGVLASSGDRTLHTPRLEAELTRQGGSDGPMAMRVAEAFDGVTVTTASESISGRRGLYDAAAQTITILDDVTIRRGGNVLTGARAVVNLATGVSSLQGDGARVRGVVIPDSVDAPAP